MEMMKVEVVQRFPYSPHGYDNAVADVGVQELPVDVAKAAIADKWAKPVKSKKGED